MRRLIIASLTAVFLAGCSGASEQPILNQLFTASRLRDNTTLNGFSMVALDPRTQGSVTTFSIVSVTPETSTPLTLKTLAGTYEAAKADDAAFTKRHDEYELAHAEEVTRVIKAGRDAKLKGPDSEVQAAWFKMIDEGIDVSRKVSEAKRKLSGESGLIDMSVNDPRNPIDVTKYDGVLVSKDVTVDATVRTGPGQLVPKTYIVTMKRAVLKGGPKGDITGRWIVTGLKEASAPAPATQAS